MFAASGPSESGTFFRVHFMVFKGFKMIFKCFQNLMARFSMCISRGYWPNSALHVLFGVFLCTLRMLLQNSACRALIGFLSHFSNS